MLRNDFINKFKEKKPYELDSKFRDDDNHILDSNRPLSEKSINKVPFKYLHKFVHDVLKDRKISSVLYSTNADKEIKIVNKSNKSTYSKMKKSLTKSNNPVELNPMDIFRNRNKKEIITQITKETIIFKNTRRSYKEGMDEKNGIFFNKILHEKISHIDHTKEELKRGLEKTFNSLLSKLKEKNKCNKNQILTHKILDLPNVRLDITDVFSRLYHNSVLINTKKESILHKLLPEGNKNKFVVKNVIDSKGKEFTIKITDEHLMKCFSKHSGGPSIENNKINSNFNSDEKNILLEMKNSDGSSLLHLSVKENLTELVDYLVTKGVDVNTQNNEGDTPLHFAIKTENHEIIRLLLNRSANIDVVNNRNENPVDIASHEIKKYFNLENLLMIKKWHSKKL